MCGAAQLWASGCLSAPLVTPKQATDDQPQTSTTTLGDLLYAGQSHAVAEEEWVRLVEAVGAGDQQALKALYERSHRMVFTLAMRISNSREIAEELTLDVFHDVWRKASNYNPKDGTVVGWIMMQARSRSIDRVRFEQRKKRVDPGGHEVTVEADPADAVDAQRQRSELQGALATLTPDERQTIETAFFSELTYSETAARLEQPLGTVKTRVRSALAKLRKALHEGEP